MPLIPEERGFIAPAASADNGLRGFRGQPQHWCTPCVFSGRSLAQQSQGALFRCSACKIHRYCSREHQAQDRATHRVICKNMKKGRTELAKEEDAVRNATPDFMTPANAFETDVGRFWGLHSTRPYMQARFLVAEACRESGTLDGVTEALEHMQDMLHLCASDNLGIRYIVPTTMLRLDRDQEAYDFVKWWQTEGADGGGHDDETSTVIRQYAMQILWKASTSCNTNTQMFSTWQPCCC